MAELRDSSTGYTRPRAGFAFYNASKSAMTVSIGSILADSLLNLTHPLKIATKTMALEYAPTIRFNCIAPTVGNTTMYAICGMGMEFSLTITRLLRSVGNDDQSDQKMEDLINLIPMRRVTEPADVANAAWYLASNESSFVTGTIIEVNLL